VNELDFAASTRFSYRDSDSQKLELRLSLMVEGIHINHTL